TLPSPLLVVCRSVARRSSTSPPPQRSPQRHILNSGRLLFVPAVRELDGRRRTSLDTHALGQQTVLLVPDLHGLRSNRHVGNHEGAIAAGHRKIGMAHYADVGSTPRLEGA